jgi:hypothetical protein
VLSNLSSRIGIIQSGHPAIHRYDIECRVHEMTYCGLAIQTSTGLLFN